MVHSYFHFKIFIQLMKFERFGSFDFRNCNEIFIVSALIIRCSVSWQIGHSQGETICNLNSFLTGLRKEFCQWLYLRMTLKSSQEMFYCSLLQIFHSLLLGYRCFYTFERFKDVKMNRIHIVWEDAYIKYSKYSMRYNI